MLTFRSNFNSWAFDHSYLRNCRKTRGIPASQSRQRSRSPRRLFFHVRAHYRSEWSDRDENDTNALLPRRHSSDLVERGKKGFSYIISVPKVCQFDLWLVQWAKRDWIWSTSTRAWEQDHRTGKVWIQLDNIKLCIIMNNDITPHIIITTNRYMILTIFLIAAVSAQFSEHLEYSQLSHGYSKAVLNFTQSRSFDTSDRTTSPILHRFILVEAIHFDTFPPSIYEMMRDTHLRKVEVKFTKGQVRRDWEIYPSHGLTVYTWTRWVVVTWESLILQVERRNRLGKMSRIDYRELFAPRPIFWIGISYISRVSGLMHNAVMMVVFFISFSWPSDNILVPCEITFGFLPREIVCTENLTPWTKLLPCTNKVFTVSCRD